MNEHALVHQFAADSVRCAWREFCRPFFFLTRRRVRSIVERLSIVSFRRVASAVFATLILASATHALSPAPGTENTLGSVFQIPPPVSAPHDYAADYAWLSRAQRADYVPLLDYVEAPTGFERVTIPGGVFADWLRRIPIAPVGTAVTGSNGKALIAADDPCIAAVLALQPRSGRLLAGGNMLVRLRAEYQWQVGGADGILFHLTSGHAVGWKPWADGVRPVIEGRKVRFKSTRWKDASRANFCAYLETLFNYTSHLSLLDDTRPPRDGTVAAGDIVLKSDRNAAPLIVMDVASNAGGELRLLLGRCGIPAQTFHVIRGADGSAWFSISQGGAIEVDGQSYEFEHLRSWSSR
ncbi:MAG TPA: DUF4846 domain-containing protein [Phycisphaerae bacterium]|nr:DUF4846 domain-containing protein [Phycisphaerae bacterium]